MSFNINQTLTNYTIYKLDCEAFEKDNQIYIHYNFTGGNLTAYKAIKKRRNRFCECYYKRLKREFSVIYSRTKWQIELH